MTTTYRKTKNLKDSGIEWVGSIPIAWDVAPVRVHLDETKIVNKGLKEQNLLSLSYGKIIKKDITSGFGLLPASFETYQIVEENQLVFRLTDLQNDKKSLRSALVIW